MHKIKILNENQEYIIKRNLKKKKSSRFIKIKDSLFEIGQGQGLIEKDGDEYYFIENYDTFLAFKNKRRIN